MDLFRRLANEPQTMRKFIVALIAAVGIAVSHGLLPAAVATWVTVLGPFLSAVGIYAVPNEAPINSEPQEAVEEPVEVSEDDATPDAEQEGF